VEEHIRANAEMVVQHLRPLSGIDFGYTKLTRVFGSFLGECIVHCYRGTWKKHESGMWCVAFKEDEAAFPFLAQLFITVEAT
jgi:hypothetical protein